MTIIKHIRGQYHVLLIIVDGWRFSGTSLTRVSGPAFVHRLIPRYKHEALPHALESLQANLHGHKGLVVSGFEHGSIGYLSYLPHGLPSHHNPSGLDPQNNFLVVRTKGNDNLGLYQVKVGFCIAKLRPRARGCLPSQRLDPSLPKLF
uniref:Alkaline phosphatase n=1 Tax=Lactuca sativa TaxID=4236 RepID=A0A9R1XM48_LACSA|nr:hypothetical protein LSAT_V11C300147260 [Lactuca sativa]